MYHQIVYTDGEAALDLQGIFVHVLGLGDAQFVSHTCCTQLENCQMHIQHNGQQFPTMYPARHIHSCDRDNSLLFDQWFQQVFYLLLSQAAVITILDSPMAIHNMQKKLRQQLDKPWCLLLTLGSRHRGMCELCLRHMLSKVCSIDECIVCTKLRLDKQGGDKRDRSTLQRETEYSVCTRYRNP